MKINKAKALSISILFILAAFVIIISMSYDGGNQFKWFSGFKMNTIKSKDSIALGTWSFIIVGIGLSISGLSMQALTRNQLASSYSMGTIAGAALSMVLVKYVMSPSSYIVEIILSFLIMMGISFITMSLTMLEKVDPSKVIVIGLTMSVLISSVTYVLKYIYNINSEMIGFLSLSTMSYTWKIFWITMPIISFSSLYLIFISKELNIYMSAPEKYKTLGISKQSIRMKTSIPTIFIAICAVMLIGPISFVGIIIPHITKHIFKGSLRKHILLSIPMSIIILLSANIILTATFSYGTNINVLLGLITCPLIIYIVLRNNNV